MDQINKEKRRLYNRSRVLDSMEDDLLNKNAKVIEEIKRIEAKEKILDIKNDNIERYFAEKKAYYDNTLKHFSPSERRLINPHYYKVDISDDLYNLKMSIINKLVTEIRNFKL